ncbi:MAG: hypothetical protein ACP6IY_14780, partial [Promethearchaeia archaeon]
IILKLEIVEAPTEVTPGEDFKLSLKITNTLTGNPIAGINVKIKVDFGSGLFYEETLKTSYSAPKTSATGLVSFTVPVPDNAEKCEISIQCLGNDTIGDFNYNFELNIKSTEKGTEKEEGAKPPELPFDPFIFIIIIIAVLGIVIGIAVGRKKGKEEKISKKEAVSEVKAKVQEKVEKQQKAIKEKTPVKEIKTEKAFIKFDEIAGKKPSKKDIKVKTIVIEHEKPDVSKVFKPEIKKKEGAKAIPVKIRDQIESIILKILYKEKAVKTQKILVERVLDEAVKKKLTISEKNIREIIADMRKNNKIRFTQKEGWRIQI